MKQTWQIWAGMSRIYAVKDHYHVLGMCSTLELHFTLQKKARPFPMCETPLSVPRATTNPQAAADHAVPKRSKCCRKRLSFKWEPLYPSGKDGLGESARSSRLLRSLRWRGPWGDRLSHIPSILSTSSHLSCTKAVWEILNFYQSKLLSHTQKWVHSEKQHLSDLTKQISHFYSATI